MEDSKIIAAIKIAPRLNPILIKHSLLVIYPLYTDSRAIPGQKRIEILPSAKILISGKAFSTVIRDYRGNVFYLSINILLKYAFF
jgi:hypothetical protein